MSFDSGYFNLGYLDSLSYDQTFVHRLDPRVKLLVSLVFIVLVVSFPKYEISGLIPFFAYPLFLISIGNIPFLYIMKKLLIVSPFVLFVGIFNPILDREIILSLGGTGIAGGWISFISIILKFTLTISTAFLLIATTSFVGICEALNRLRVPDIFVIQLLFLYRYLFVLLEEAFKMVWARNARSFGKKGYDMRTFTSLLSVLLMRTLQRAERIYGAMISRGYHGKIILSKTHRIDMTNVIFSVISIALFIVLRFFNFSEAIGTIIKDSMG
jgi:cobalt/nickel transport system permease protein